ncbi:cobyrinic acid a,c-diamide synthase [Caballeronia catudaia]|uniref:Cobyrinic acid a,c-diamide synthase n=1 Tax=Caballeronia catudaia TaxID=1777136 RepID=A0A158DR68_9BURK|nr:ParA family protein [Caballeronia catudaia]SAK97084.1 cobyrinic acid a,c-diamide synthase [Caballeronia catudaia]
MTARIIGVVQVKGGAGRSTLATNLAGAIAASGRKVALIDADMPQGTAASWAAMREQNRPTANLTVETSTDHETLVKAARTLAEKCDVIVIDGPPRIAETTRAALILSDVCLIPLGTSAAEIWATSDLMRTIEEAREAGKRVGKTIDARIVWNRYRAGTTAAKELPEAVKDQLPIKALQTRLGFRVAYSDALAEGLTVAEWSDRAARDELGALCVEIGKILRMKIA